MRLAPGKTNKNHYLCKNKEIMRKEEVYPAGFKEYADRDLSYGELAQLDGEFDEAFVVDDDCLDDESENGLGANARITYVDDRRRGAVSGPEEFAEIYGVKEEWRKYTKR